MHIYILPLSTEYTRKAHINGRRNQSTHTSVNGMTVSSIVYFVKMSKIQNLHFNSLREPQYPREKRKKEEIASNRIARNRKGDRTAHWLKYVPVDMGMKSENNICERIVLSPCVSCINIGRVGRKNRLGYSNLGRRRVNSEPERGRQRLSASRARCKERQKKEGFAKETRKGSNRYHRQGGFGHAPRSRPYPAPHHHYAVDENLETITATAISTPHRHFSQRIWPHIPGHPVGGLFRDSSTLPFEL